MALYLCIVCYRLAKVESNGQNRTGYIWFLPFSEKVCQLLALDDYPWDQTMKNSALGPLSLYVSNKGAIVCVYFLI